MFRTLCYLPSVVSGVAVALLWIWLLHPDFGIINAILGKLGIPGPRWLFSERWAIPGLILMGLWRAGGSMIIFLAGLQAIPSQLYDAVALDGAGSWRKFLHITLPILSPTILFSLVMGLIESFQIFLQSFVMTGGGPNNATLTYILYLYRKAFEQFHMGYACALAWIFFIIILSITLLVFKSSPLWLYYEGELRGK